MSRIGTQPVSLPANVTVELTDKLFSAKGPKGELNFRIPKGITIKQEADNTILVERSSDAKAVKSLHGLTRSLVNNTVQGVSEGFSKELEVNGVGFKASVSGRKITLALGYSHEINYEIPEGIEATVDQNKITISGIDKQLVGHVAAEIRALRKPEPYKGKGIRYTDEYVIRKAGKTAAGGKE